MDAYVRVSRVAGREGERFISPGEQRARIEQWLVSQPAVEIVQWWEELDQSGANAHRPMFQEALARCERGESGGIVVAKLDRFARSAVDALTSIQRLNAAGARFVSVEDGFDGSNPMGRFAIGMMCLIAELELERIRGGWQAAVGNAIGRGVYISSVPPTGYRRGEDGRLVVDEEYGPLVVELFRRRAAGASWSELARFCNRSGLPTTAGNPVWVEQTVRGIISNRAYLGHARQGSVVNEDAHPALVSRAEWEAAQVAPSVHTPRDGSVASRVLLGGLIVCGGCGHNLRVTASGPRENRIPIYYCHGEFAAGPCPARASGRASRIDQWVEEQFLAELASESGIAAVAVAARAETDEVLGEIAAAEAELDAYLANTQLLTVIGQERWTAVVEQLQRRLDLHRHHLAELQSQAQLLDALTPGNLLEAWPELSILEKRRVLHGFVDRVVLRAHGGGPRRFDPSRIQIVWRGEAIGSDPGDLGVPVTEHA